jgi:hypothetical protein
VIAVLGYGLLLPQLGFYWDELPMTWIRYELGPAAMTRYFSTNRPVWGLVYQVTTRLLPQIPIYWQLFALLWRWVSALLVWAIVRHLWPTERQLAMIVGLAFLLYPGFSQQWTSFLYSHFFIVLCFLLFSFLCMIWSFQGKRWYWPLTALGMLFAGLNLWMMEYFYVLELFRPFIILRTVSAEGDHRWAPRIRRAIALWLPYVGVFVANVLWRVFVFNNQIYRPSLLSNLRSAPIVTTVNLLKTIVTDLYTVSLSAWWEVLGFPNPAVTGPRTILFYFVVVLVTAALVGLFLSSMHAEHKGNGPIGLSAIGLGVVAMLAAGWPFWLTGLDITLAFPANRFTLPFMLGVALILGGLLALVPPTIRVGLAVVLLGLAAGRQALLADSYRRDWATQKSMFWQMSWRAPGISPHTMVLLNEGALPYFADNSLTAALNWIYDPGNRDGAMDYVLFYPTSRLGGTLQALAPGQSITYDFIAEVFTGSTSQTLAFYYQPPGCLRLLDPLYDTGNHLLPDASLMRDAAALSSSEWITAQATARMPAIYGPEPAHDWCYYYEQADLAAQLGDWPRIAALGDQAFALNDYPNDPVERFVFVEGYAHEGNWAKALGLSNTSYKVSKVYMGPLLCRLWGRIENGTTDSASRSATLAEVKRLYACSSE